MHEQIQKNPAQGDSHLAFPSLKSNVSTYIAGDVWFNLSQSLWWQLVGTCTSLVRKSCHISGWEVLWDNHALCFAFQANFRIALSVSEVTWASMTPTGVAQSRFCTGASRPPTKTYTQAFMILINDESKEPTFPIATASAFTMSVIRKTWAFGSGIAGSRVATWQLPAERVL